jgi:hypothetical protein
MKPPLTLLEEFVLLSLDDKTGAHLPLPPSAYGFGLAGAILSDLVIAERISTETKQVKVLNKLSTGNTLLDPWLDVIAASPGIHSIHYWIARLSDHKREIEKSAITHLIERGILKREDKKILWVVGLRRYPTIHNEERLEVRTRLRNLILTDENPDHFDATLISLLQGSYLLDEVFVGESFLDRGDRINFLANSDPVGKEVAATTKDTLDALLITQGIPAPGY